MRLGTCIALELAVAAGATVGGYVAISHVATFDAHGLVAPPASAATASPVEPLPRSWLNVAYSEAPENIFGASDTELLAPLGAAPITRVKTNLGGTSLSLRLDFANGARAAFKPEQIHLQSDPRREIAAYRIDRLLGIGHVAPAKSAAIRLTELLAAIDPSYRTHITNRITEEAIVRDGMVYGELSWWIPEIKRAKLGKEFIDEREGKALWSSYLEVGAVIPPELRSMVAQISTLIVFDVLIDNADRWSGNNTVMSPDGTLLYFLDNTLAFSTNKLGHRIPTAALWRIQVFPRRLIERLRRLTAEELEATLALGKEDKLRFLLRPNELRAVLARRDNIITYVDELIAAHGEDAVLALP